MKNRYVRSIYQNYSYISLASDTIISYILAYFFAPKNFYLSMNNKIDIFLIPEYYCFWADSVILMVM